MKVLIVACILTCVVYVIGEPCFNDADCVNHHITVCGANSHVTCDSRISQCVCISGPSATTCTTRADCANMPNCRDRDQHCVDGTCRCTNNQNQN